MNFDGFASSGGSNNTWFTCGVCHKNYSQKSNLRRHIRSVHDKFQVQCSIYGSLFKRKDYLNRHLKLVHPDQSISKSNATSPSSSSTDYIESISRASQTKKCRLSSTKILVHMGTGTEPTINKDSASETDPPPTTVDRARNEASKKHYLLSFIF